MFKKIFFTFLISIFSFVFTFADNTFFIDQYPSNPKEGEDTYFNLKSEIYNLSKTNIVWKVNGITEDEGVGRITFIRKAPSQQKEEIVSAEIEDLITGTVKTEVILRPNPFLIFYEGVDSYVPPFYKGRSLPGKEGYLRAGLINFDNNLDVSWEVGGDSVKEKGKVIEIKSRVIDNNINLRAILRNTNTPDQNPNEVETIVKIQKPDIRLYSTDENKNSKKIIDTQIKNEKGVYLLVEPFYVSGNTKKSKNLSYSWTFNDKLKVLSTPWFIKIDESSGKVRTSVEVKNSEKIIQYGNKSFDILGK